jgi:hypothetical protein
VLDTRNPGEYVTGGSMDSEIPFGWGLGGGDGVYSDTGGNPGGCMSVHGWSGWVGGNLNTAFPLSSTTQVRVQFDYKAGDGYVWNGNTYVPGVRFGIYVGNTVSDGYDQSGGQRGQTIETTSTTTSSHYDSGWITLNSADLCQLRQIYILANPMAGPTLYAGTGYYDNVSVTTR